MKVSISLNNKDDTKGGYSGKTLKICAFPVKKI